MRNQTGFTLIELLVVVAIIAIVASIAIPGLMNAVNRSKQSSTMADMRALGTALERYALDHDRYPEAGDVQALREHLEPRYIPRVPVADGWRNLFVVEIDEAGYSYTVRSLGKDGEAQSTPPTGVTHTSAADIIYSNGAFLQRPVGAQD